MVRWKPTYCLLILISIISNTAFAQRHLTSEVHINTSSVYVGQPVEVSVAVFTSTWFTKGVDPGNIKVNDAFTVYFRSLSTSKKVNGQTYAGVILYFHVFPYNDEDIEFPSLEINVETPDVGGFKGIKHIIKTNSKTIKVKAVPAGFNKAEWLVTSNMTVQDNWQGGKTNVKVGDVLERSITRNVAGTVSELVPPIIWDTIPSVSLYPTRSSVKNNKTKTAISATRTDGVRYLFEKEGEVIIPAMELTWWNPYQNKLYKRTLKGFTINVQPNPDLGMLESVRDTLNASTIEENEALKNSPITILGLSIKQFIIAFLCLLLFIYLSIKIGKKLLVKFKIRKQNYLNSELYYFRQFKKSIKSQNQKLILQKLYQWIGFLNLKEPTLNYFATQYGSTGLMKEISIIENQLESKKIAVRFIEKNWLTARKKYLKNSPNHLTKKYLYWINP